MITRLDQLTPEQKELLLTKIVLRIYELEEESRENNIEPETIGLLAQGISGWIDEQV